MAASTAGAGVVVVGGALLYGRRRERAAVRRVRLEQVDRAIGRRDLGEAGRVLDELLAGAPGDPELLFRRAQVARAAGDYNTARARFLETLARDPRRADARAELFDLTLAAGAREEAEHNLRKLEEMVGAGDPRVRQRRARIGADRGEGEK